MPGSRVMILKPLLCRKRSCEGRSKSLSSNSREGSFEEEIDLNQFDILRFMEAEEENCGFDTSCLEKLNIAPDFMVNLYIYYVTYDESYHRN